MVLLNNLDLSPEMLDKTGIYNFIMNVSYLIYVSNKK